MAWGELRLNVMQELSCGNGPGSLEEWGNSQWLHPHHYHSHNFFISFEIALFGEGVGVAGG